MAIPNRLKSTFRPLRTVGKAIGPTGIGVLLSISAHAGIIAASAQGSSGGGGGGGLFEAFDELTEEEKVVPIVQLTPAERSRLPSFAQPRRDPLSASSLGTLDLPPGLRAPTSTAIGQPRTTVPAGRMPAPTVAKKFSPPQPINDLLEQIKARATTAPTRPQPPVPTTLPGRTSASAYIQPSVVVPPASELGDINSGQSNVGSAADLGQPSADSGLPQLEAQSTEDILARLQRTQTQPEISAETSNSSESVDSNESTDLSTGTQENQEPIDIPAIVVDENPDEVTTLALNPADGDPAELREELAYDDRLTSETAVAQKIDAWSTSIAEQKGDLPQAETQVEINAAFKACRTNPPNDGLMGVVVNPGGEIETLDVLQSTGYETLNLRAQEAVENYDFSNVTEPTDYRVSVKVDYDAEGCVDVEGLRKRLVD